jgi:hypothetical protein
VKGEGLDARIARAAIPFDEALPIARQIAEALEAAHEIAFRGRSGDTRRIYLRDLSREIAEPVSGTEGGDDAFFSPDGEWLGFVAGDKAGAGLLAGRAASPLPHRSPEPIPVSMVVLLP